MAVILAAACVMLGGSGCALRERKSVFIDPALVVLIPPDVTRLGGLRLRELRKTPWEGAVREAGLLTWLDEFFRRSGLEADKEIWELVAAGVGEETLLLVRGKFSEFGGMEPRLVKPGLRRFQYKGFSLQGDEDDAIVFLNSSTAALGSLRRLRAALDLREQKVAPRPEAVLALASAIPPDAHLWLVSRAPAPEGREAEAGVHPGWWKSLGQASSLLAYAELGRDVRIHAELAWPDVASAGDWEAALRSALTGKTETGAPAFPLLSARAQWERRASRVRLEVRAQGEAMAEVVRFLAARQAL